jgi:hypothetical protein
VKNNMDSSSAIYKVAIATGVTLAVAALATYLFRKESGKSASSKKVLSADEISKAQLLRILEEIHVAHEKMRLVTKKLSAAILASKLNFEQTYQRVIESQPEDPLEKYGLSMMDFDRLLEREQYDPEVRESLSKLMASPEPASLDSTKDLSLAQVLEIHRFILTELQTIVKDVSSLSGSYDSKTVMIAAQAIVGAHVEGKFGASGDDVEVATSKLSMPLSGNAEFNSLNLQIQQVMTELMTISEQKKH